MSGKIWHGSWSDGKTALSHPIEIRLSEDGLHFHLSEEQGQSHFWAFKELRSPNPVEKNSDHVMLTSNEYAGERLFVNDKTFSSEILKQAPNISAHAHQWSLLKIPLAMALFIVGFWLLTYLDIISPSKRIAFWIPDNVRNNLGTGVVNFVRRNGKLCSTPAGDAALQKIITRLKPATPKNQNLSIRIADMKIVNAFAAPGDKIIVSTKLVEEAENVDEVTGVIAHEIGHAIERHPEAGIVRALGLVSLMQLLTAGEAGAISDIAFFMIQSGYSRDAEQEADEHAARILNSTNINTKPLAGFFERIISKYELKKKQREEKETAEKSEADNKDKSEKSALEETGKTLFDFLSTHPPTKKRIEFFSKSEVITTPPILNEAEWQALRTICGTKKKTKTNDSEKEGKEGGTGSEDQT